MASLVSYHDLDDRPSSSSSDSATSHNLSTASVTTASVDGTDSSYRPERHTLTKVDSDTKNHLIQQSVILSSLSSSTLPRLAAGARPKVKGKRGSTMNGPLYMQSGPNSQNPYMIHRRKDQNDDGLITGLMRWLVQNQIGASWLNQSWWQLVPHL